MISDWYKVHKITGHIYAIDDRGSSWMYLVVGSEKALLIDTGWGGGNLRDVISSITDLPLVVINTHGHPDHVGGNNQFEAVHIAAGDVPVLEGCFRAENRKWALENEIIGPYPEEFDPDKWLYAKPGRIIALESNQQFDLGGRKIEVIGIPGHSPGCIALLEPEEKILFSGDSVLAGNIWMHLDHSSTLSAFLASLTTLKLQIARFDTLLPGHGKTPIQSGIIDELIGGIKDILAGSSQGELHHTFAGEGLLCTFANCGIVYNPNKL